MNNFLHLWSEKISLVDEWISLDSNSSRVKIHFSASEISPGSLDIHSKRSDHWRHYPRSENKVNWVILESTYTYNVKTFMYIIFTHTLKMVLNMILFNKILYVRYTLKNENIMVIGLKLITWLVGPTLQLTVVTYKPTSTATWPSSNLCTTMTTYMLGYPTNTIWF